VSGTTLFDRVGQHAITDLVDDFYLRVIGDDRVAGYFTVDGQVDAALLARVKSHQYRMFTVVAGGAWTGETRMPDLSRWMQDAHRDVRREDGEPITDGAFAIVAGHLSDALDAAHIGEEDKRDLLGKVGALRDLIVARG
jgi:hemoglobin